MALAAGLVRKISTVAVVAAASVALSPGFATAEPGFSPQQVIPIPGANPAEGDYAALACASTSTCTAVGETGAGDLLVAAEASGTWGTPQTIALPAGALRGGLDAVTCPSEGNCLAVGQFETSGDDWLPVVVSQTSGTWGAAASVLPPPGAPPDTDGLTAFSDAWCASAGNCTAVGSFEIPGGTQLMSAVETSGTWGATAALLPISGWHVSPSLACTSTGNCTAVAGPYAWKEASSSWGAPTLIAGPPDSSTSAFFAGSIACTDATTCIAVGGVSGDRWTQAATVTETSGVWGALQLLPTPNLSPGTSVSGLASISCQPTVCVAVGQASNNYGPYQQEYPIALTWSSGTWSSMGLEQINPAGSGQNPGSWLGAVSCASAARCLAVGVAGVFTPSGGPVGAYSFSTVLEPVRPVVAPGAPAMVNVVPTLGGATVHSSPPYDDGGAPITSFTATAAPGGASCTTDNGTCEITGLANGNTYIVTATDSNASFTSPPVVSSEFVVGATPAVPTGIHVALSGSSATISWRPSASPTGEPVLRYLVLVHGKGGERVTTTDWCTVRGLVRGRSYAAGVLAVDASGRSLPTTMRFVAT